MIQEIGGFQSSLFLFGLFVVSTFSKRLYYASLISKWFLSNQPEKMYQTDLIRERKKKLDNLQRKNSSKNSTQAQIHPDLLKQTEKGAGLQRKNNAKLGMLF